MNSRYTYKAKRKDNGEWVYGYYFKFSKESSVFHRLPGEYIYTDNGIYCIDVKTLCQCTGLTDIEGNYIFENDILNGLNKFNEIIDTFTIVWNTDEASFEVIKINGKNHISFDTKCWLNKVKINGNKFDEVK